MHNRLAKGKCSKPNEYNGDTPRIWICAGGIWYFWNGEKTVIEKDSEDQGMDDALGEKLKHG